MVGWPGYATIPEWISNNPSPIDIRYETTVESVSRGDLLKGDAIKAVGSDARDATHYAKMDMDTYCNPAALLLELLPYRGLEVYYGAMVAGERRGHGLLEPLLGGGGGTPCPGGTQHGPWGSS